WPLQAHLARKGVKRSLGRVSLHFPDALLAMQLRIVAQYRNAAEQLQNRILGGELDSLSLSPRRGERVGVKPLQRSPPHPRPLSPCGGEGRQSGGLTDFLDLAVAGVTFACDLVCGFRGDGRNDHHLHERERPRFVGANPRDRTEGFHRGEAPYDRIALRHTL